MRDETDRILDEGLGTYSCFEPRPGIEERVLARVRSESLRRSFRGYWALAFASAAALAIVAGGLWMTRRPLPEIARADRPMPHAPAPVRTVEKRARVERQAARPRSGHNSKPAGLSAQERAWLMLAQTEPGLLRAALTEAPAEALAPIRIDPIEIKPLQMDGSQ